METINLALNLKKEELKKLPQELQDAMKVSKDKTEQEKARRDIAEAYKGLDHTDLCLRGHNFWNFFHMASEYKWPFDPQLVILLNVALHLRFNWKAMTDPFELRMISTVLSKKEIGNGLGESPWKEMFLASAETEMPEVQHLEALIMVVKTVGIEESTYIYALRKAVASEEKKSGFSLDALETRKKLDISPLDDYWYINSILESIDKKLRNDKNLIYKVIREYETLQNRGINIGPSRRSVVEAYRKAQGGEGDKNALRAAMKAGIIPMEEEEKKAEDAKTKPWWKFWKK